MAGKPDLRGTGRFQRPLVLLLLLAAVLSIFASPLAAAEIVFLQDGHTIRAEKSEIIFDRIRITTPTEIIDLPRSAVLSIHRIDPPAASSTPTLPAAGDQDLAPQPNGSSPAEVYRGLTQRMTDRVRRAIQEQSDRSRVK